MVIFRVQKKDNYVVLDKGFLNDTRLSWRAKGLLAYMLSLPNDWLFSISDLAIRSKCGRDTTANIIRELTYAGYIQKEQGRTNLGKFCKMDLLVFEAPSAAPLTENLVTDKSSTENPQTESPQTKSPLMESPQTENPLAESPQTENPLTESPQTENPLTESPQTKSPLMEIPQTKSPLAESPQTENPLTESPLTENPLTENPSLLINKSLNNNLLNNKNNDERRHCSAENLPKTQTAFQFYEQNGFGALASHVAYKIGHWIDDLSEDLVIHAMKLAVENNVVRWNYVNKILHDWTNKKYKTIEEVEAGRLRFATQKKQRQHHSNRSDQQGRQEVVPEWFHHRHEDNDDTESAQAIDFEAERQKILETLREVTRSAKV
ncbi:DnaD domain protein [Lysinibacillus sp. fls2-241-R2A-57]|uniref:DnaD domain protein n=1 Tax=Lysinibacillus sp. fls2-241-R2A-57 TaxID=3040292 RepID=UPI002556A123|nr:DnaD domain protein [Lysinibacillus sp. fls2-241-R2A-57]